MLFKQTLVITSDKTSVKLLKIFHLYKGFFRKKTKESFFIKGSVKKVKPPVIEYKGFKRKTIKKGDVKRGVIIKTTSKKTLNDQKKIVFNINSILIIKKKFLFISKYFFGFNSFIIKRKKILLLFNNYILRI